MAESGLHIFGVRHHGPGSARSLLRALEDLKPDVILLEGPPDAQDILALAGDERMKPPVALLVYPIDSPQQSVFYPFATFSPEWQAVQFGHKHKVPVRFMDLPQWHRLSPEASPSTDARASATPSDGADPAGAMGQDAGPERAINIRPDPLDELARAAGYGDGESWWDRIVENRRDHDAVFQAVREAMIALRQEAGPAELEEQRREAYMRKTIRAALKENFKCVAVICGAWHVPALQEPDAKGRMKADNELLHGLPKTKTGAAWVPWTYDRLSYWSGYGAGVASPEWYHLLWRQRDYPAVQWLTRVARLMRGEDLDASSAHIIEAVRLAEALAALRGRPLPGLEELDETALTVMCFGNPAPMQLVRRKLVVGERLGRVPEDAPTIPLHQDLMHLQKKLRMPLKAVEKDYDLDLRESTDLQRSHLLHRLNLLDVPWGKRQESGRRAKGTFHEVWRVLWEPEFVVRLIMAGRWGNTIEIAASTRAIDEARSAKELPQLTALLDDAILADLPEAVAALIAGIQAQAAVGADIPHLMEALPPLANVSRYGNVRGTDVDMVLEVVSGLAARICVGLPNACASLDDEAAKAMFDRVVAVDAAIAMLDRPELLASWNTTLRQLAEQCGLHGLIAGRACRLLHDRHEIEPVQTQQRFGYALSSAADPGQAAGWLEGFLAGSGLILIHDEALWRVVDQWVQGLSDVHFQEVLPLLRRTFATFEAPAKRQMGERVKRGEAASAAYGGVQQEGEFDTARADALIPVLARILGVELS